MKTKTNAYPWSVLKVEDQVCSDVTGCHTFKLNWRKIHLLRRSSLEEVTQRHADVFEEGLCTLQGYEAKLILYLNASPRFLKARPVPYSMRELVEKDLDRLVTEGILEPVQFADWATPIS